MLECNVGGKLCVHPAGRAFPIFYCNVNAINGGREKSTPQVRGIAVIRLTTMTQKSPQLPIYRLLLERDGLWLREPLLKWATDYS